MKLSNDHIALPREDYIELQTAAWDTTPRTTTERIGTAVEITAMTLSIAAAVTAGTWGWAKAVDWLETRRLDRIREEIQFKLKPTPTKD